MFTQKITVARGVDYDSGPYDITIPVGMTSASFNITINNDNVLEDDEIFYLIIRNSHPNNVTRGEIDRVVVTIVNHGGSSKCAFSFN